MTMVVTQALHGWCNAKVETGIGQWTLRECRVVFDPGKHACPAAPTIMGYDDNGEIKRASRFPDAAPFLGNKNLSTRIKCLQLNMRLKYGILASRSGTSWTGRWHRRVLVLLVSVRVCLVELGREKPSARTE